MVAASASVLASGWLGGRGRDSAPEPEVPSPTTGDLSPGGNIIWFIILRDPPPTQAQPHLALEVTLSGMRVGEAQPPLDQMAVEPGGRKRDWMALMALSLSSLLRETPYFTGFYQAAQPAWGSQSLHLVDEVALTLPPPGAVLLLER